jgi:hypothetical protein
MVIGTPVALPKDSPDAGDRQGGIDMSAALRTPPVRTKEEIDEDVVRLRGRGLSGRYAELFDYLERRYASTVVLTFAQMEDLVGFALPDRARTDREWWAADPRSAEGSYANAWMQARRTATPNLLARNVVFERASA